MNPVDKFAHRNDIADASSTSILVLVTLPVNLGSDMIRVSVIVGDNLR